jgi:predicted SAM-dependent methyltransferase
VPANPTPIPAQRTPTATPAEAVAADSSSAVRNAVKRLALKVIPQHAFAVLRFELHMVRVRLMAPLVRRRFRHADNLLVNLGAGTVGKPGWVNVDASAFDGINCVYDMRRGLPFPDASVRGLFCEHFLEHLDYDEEAPMLLRDCHRVLKPGGVLRIIVPDAEAYLRAYCEDGWDMLTRVRPLLPGRVDSYFGNRYDSKMQAVNMIFRQGTEHKYAYDAETLMALLRRCGFARVEHQSFGRTLLQDLNIDLPERATESLYVEGQKV